jgi:hypothetical protein
MSGRRGKGGVFRDITRERRRDCQGLTSRRHRARPEAGRPRLGERAANLVEAFKVGLIIVEGLRDG